MIRRRLFASLSLCAAFAGGAVPATALLMTSAGTAHASSDDWQLIDSGNMWDGGWGNLWQGPQLEVSQRQLERIGDVLRLDDAQRDDLVNLYMSLEEQHLEAWVEFAEASGDANNAFRGGDYDWQKIQEETEERTDRFTQKQDELIGLLFEDLQLIITQDQLERWPLVELEQRRQQMLGRYGCYPKERFDLVAAVGTLDLDEAERAALEPVLKRYAEEMDPLLQARHRALEHVDKRNEGIQDAQSAIYSIDWESDPAAAQQAYEKAMERANEMQQDVIRAALAARPACRRVGELNERYLEEITGMLDVRGRTELERMTAETANDTGEWDPFSYSRSKQIMSFLLNMDEMIAAWGAYADSADDDSGMGMMRLARNVEPLRPDQVMRIEEMLEELDAERELLSMEAPQSMLPQVDDAQKNNFTLTTPGGSYTLQRIDTGHDESAMAWGGMGGGQTEEDAEKMQAYQQKQSEMEQRYIERIRDLLTVRQRALIAFQ